LTLCYLNPNGGFEESVKGDGVHHAGNSVNVAFKDWLLKLGPNVKNYAKTKEYLFNKFVEKNFELFKTNIDNIENPRRIQVSRLLAKAIKKDAPNLIGKNDDGDNYLRLEPKTLFEVFAPSLQGGGEKLNAMLRTFGQGTANKVSFVVMVGGYSKSPVLQNMVKDAVTGRGNVMNPPEKEAAIVLGALYFSENLWVIGTRVARKTYMVETMRKWRNGDGNRPSWTDPITRERYTKGVAHILCEIDSKHKYDDFKTFKASTYHDNQRVISLGFYSSTGKFLLNYDVFTLDN
jgi:molecular chaperone DnaK (HSP70)